VNHQRTTHGVVARTPRPVRHRFTRLARGVVATLSLVLVAAPLTVLNVASSSADQFSGDATHDIVVGAPAVAVAGVDDAFRVSVAAGAPFVIPAVSDGVSTDVFHYATTGTNTAGCTVTTDGKDFAYATTGQCTLQITAVPTVDSDGDTDGLTAGSFDVSWCDEFGFSECAESATLTVTVTSAPQSIVLASATVVYPWSTPLRATGYVGSGPVSYAVTGGTATGCTITTQSVLSTTSTGTCLVVASIAAGGGYSASSSSVATFSFVNHAQSIALASQSAHFPSSFALRATGYLGSGPVTYAVTGGTATGCAINAQNILSTSTNGTCLVVASIAAGGGYSAASSSVATFDVASRAQSIYLASQSVRFRASVPLVATGYLGGGVITYAIAGGTASGCVISVHHRVTARSPGTCLVIAGIASDSTYSSAVSDVATITFRHPPVVILAQSIGLASTRVSYHGALALQATGYYGFGIVSYQLVGGSAAGCTISPSDVLTASSAGTCLVSASIAAAGRYAAAVSPVATITFDAAPPPPPPPPPPPTVTMSVVPFAEGSVVLTPALDNQIAAIAARVKSMKYHVIDVTGYTDNVFTPAFNQTLNQSRASAVVAQLTSDLAALHVTGVTVDIVTNPTSYVFQTGPNVTAQNRAINRRVVATLKVS